MKSTLGPGGIPRNSPAPEIDMAVSSYDMGSSVVGREGSELYEVNSKTVGLGPTHLGARMDIAVVPSYDMESPPVGLVIGRNCTPVSHWVRWV